MGAWFAGWWLVVFAVAPARAEPSDAASPAAAGPGTASASGDASWLWALGGVMVVLGIFLAWRFLLSARR